MIAADILAGVDFVFHVVLWVCDAVRNDRLSDVSRGQWFVVGLPVASVLLALFFNGA